jgi:very-long-chain enoyl-CoA reductase
MPAFGRRTHLVISYSGAIVAFIIAASRGVPFPDADPAILHWELLPPALLWMLHFSRRTAESAWLHRFGKKNIAWSQAPIPWLYYWGFAAWIGRDAAIPEFTVSFDLIGAIGIVLFCCGEVGNFRSHLLLRRLRAESQEQRLIPKGCLFEFVSCPHYFFEIVTWTGFSMVTGLLSAAVFTLAGAAIMGVWATQRHRAYLAEFDGNDGRERYPERRKIIIPFLY